MEISQEERYEIEELLLADTSALLEIIGRQALRSLSRGKDIFGLREVLPQDFVGWGRRDEIGDFGADRGIRGAIDLRVIGGTAFDRVRDLLYREICVKWDFCNKPKSRTSEDEVSLIAGLGDILTTCLGGFPSTVIAVYLVKIGLNKFCSCD
ncbi:MAG: hypothetical protein KQH53_11080 [Desulfarculaceae bacterium]|nr:hypothetical protein [Desulfarculaceae bacterium]